jgi:tetratricopeptide (TPR) repeat protein
MIASIIAKESNLDPIEAQLRKIEDYISEGKPNEALKMINKKLFLAKGYQARAHTAMAEIWLKMLKFDKAQAAIEESLKTDPEYAPALRIKAKIASKMGRHEEAITLLQKMSTASPKNFSAKIDLGSAYINADRHDDAKKVLGEVLELDDDCQDCKDALATVAIKEGDMSLAAQLIAETENGDELASVFNNLAISQVGKGQFDKAIETYGNAMNLLADKARVHLLHYNLALAWKKKGDLKKCFDELCNSYLKEPSFEKAYASLARTLQEMKAKNIAADKNLISKVKQARNEYLSSHTAA